ncbi:glycoside hydrolase family 32 protein [Paraflavisolibacter sp. H34]|uniref:glycoside hydrolase family 32 protein n=1 Tax=Huijunlia imazamoxiresistens TaxID=3127457 RepID=UPI0030183C03
MKTKILGFLALAFLAACGNANNAPVPDAPNGEPEAYNEPYRPKIHFSPKTGWMNDPNGMVYHNGTYHLFYQYYPDSTVWGPMHWGHATSRDLVRWEHQPVALYPDSLGYIFSGSAVVDQYNTTGFGKDRKTPLVAIFTHHDTVGEKAGRNTYQNQSLAYSLDDGKTWTKYAGNPVLKNPGIVDFRDPKVMWYERGKKWIMTLATRDRITFYSSPNLKEWKKESEFGQNLGAHGGVWECPDLFPLDDNGKKVWVLLVNLNPGGPNGGSATQYFLGDFDGTTFTPQSTDTQWLDYGPDEYAGITWSNTGDRKIFLGWMSNWLYAQVVPTSSWRSAMTVPRELQLKHAGNAVYLASEPVRELDIIASKSINLQDTKVNSSFDLSGETGQLAGPFRLDLELEKAADLSLVLSNEAGEELVIGYDQKANRYFIDRSKAGNSDFHKEFAARHTAPRFSQEGKMNITLIVDVSSVELFADGGLSVMTGIFFPSQSFTRAALRSAGGAVVNNLVYRNLKPVW